MNTPRGTLRAGHRGPERKRRVGGKAGRYAAVLLVAALLPAGAGCRKGGQPPQAKPPPGPPAPTFDKVWSAEEIAQDPSGYMRWAERRIEAQVADRQGRLKLLSARLADVKLRQETFLTQIADVENLHGRMKTAVRRAEDEDRWPAVVGGRSFSQAKAQAIIEQTAKWVAERRPLAQAYEQAAARLTEAEQDLRKDIEDLRNLREKLALDLERVRLSQGMEELGRLRQREEEIAGFARALTQMADESAVSSLPPDDKASEKVDIESFLK